MSFLPIFGLTLVLLGCAMSVPAQEPLPGTQPLTMQGDLARQMVDGIRGYFLKETEKARRTRARNVRRCALPQMQDTAAMCAAVASTGDAAC